MKRSALLVCWIFACLLWQQGAVLAVQPGEALADHALEARARALSAELRCMVCQNQSIDISDAELARDLRVLVRERLSAGDSDGEVLDYIVSRYGEFVLLKPRLSLRNALLWGAPVLLLLAGGLVVVRAGRSRKRTGETALSVQESAALDEILKRGQ
jgi:cytochrome c-type biogenesis protein CcmH